MEGVQQTIQEASRLWEILIYLIWPVAIGSYLFTWKIYQSIKADVDAVGKLALGIRDNELHEMGQRVGRLETGQAVNESRLDRLEE